MKTIKLFIFIFALMTSLKASYFTSTDDPRLDAKNIAFLSANSVYQLDKTQLSNILQPYLKDKYYIKALEVYENLENELLANFFRYEDKYYFDKQIPSHVKDYTTIIKEKIIHNNAEIGYIYLYVSYDIDFNKSEKQYLSKKKNITFCVDPNWMPYENIENNTYKGIGSDYIKLFEKKLNKNFTLIPTKSWVESKEKAKKRVCDILPLSSNSAKRKTFMNITKAYIKEPLVLATKIDKAFIDDLSSLKNKTIAITKGYSIVKRVKDKYPNVKVLETSGIIESLDLVSSGKVYGVVDAISIINYHIKFLHKNELKISSKLNMYYTLGIASNKDEPLLNNILNKAINSITTDEKNEIYNKWNNKQIEIVEKTDYELLLKVLFLVVFVFLIFAYRQYILRKANKDLQKKVEMKTKDLSQLNKLLEEKVKKQVEEIRNKELILMEQSKLASMGMMIGNIAHQWRQPLSIISTLSTGMMINKELGKHDDKYEYKSLKEINEATQHLSQTIETFRNFIKNDKIPETVVLQDSINLSIDIISSTLKNHEIKLYNKIFECDNITLTLVPGELSEVIINIINNAKDILLERETKNPWIKISLEKDLSKFSLNSINCPSPSLRIKLKLSIYINKTLLYYLKI